MDITRLMECELVTLDATDTLDIADDIMRLGRIRHLPVLEDGALVGLLTQRDLLAAAVSSLLQFSRAAQQEWLAGVRVRDVMATDLATVTPDTSLAQAIRLMTARKVGCLPVVVDRRLIGLLTETECMRCFADMLAGGNAKTAVPALSG